MAKDPRKILFLDIETSPSLVYTFQFWNVNISPDKIVNAGGLMCFAYSWDGEKKVNFVSGTHREMAQVAWDLLNEADVVVTYNGNKFDIPHFERAFTLEGMHSPSPFVSVDLFAVMKRVQRGVWPSLRLGYLATELEYQGKVKHDGFDLWPRYMAGEPKAQKEMERYNKRDVQILKDMWPELRHKVNNLPAASLYMDTEDRVCPNCGSEDFQSRGIQRNKTRAYRRFFCNSCHDWFRGSHSIDSSEVTLV